MSIKPHELPPRFKGTIEYLRRQQDSLLDFLHRDSPISESWLLGLERAIFETQPELLEEPGVLERLQWVIRGASLNTRLAFFLLCVTRDASLNEYLNASPDVVHHSRDRLGWFLGKTLPAMADDFLAGRDGALGPDAFVRAVRARYMTVVGVHPNPVALQQAPAIEDGEQ